MNLHIRDRWFAFCGIVFVVLELGGTFLAMASGKTHDLTISSSSAHIARAIAHPAGTSVWAGAYLELLSIGFFLAFTVWAAERLGGGLLGSLMKLAAAAAAGGGIVALAVMNVVSYRAGHGIGLDSAKTLVVLGEAVYVATWFLDAAFLVGAAILALRSGRRVIGWTAAAIVVYTLVFTPLSLDNAGQFSQMFFLFWVVGTSIAFARSPRRAPVPAVAPGV
jgi:hypothetical protein